MGCTSPGEEIDWQTGVKTLPFRNVFADGKNNIFFNVHQSKRAGTAYCGRKLVTAEQTLRIVPMNKTGQI